MKRKNSNKKLNFKPKSINMNLQPKFLILLLFFPVGLHAQWNFLNGPFSYEMYMEVLNEDTLVFSDGSTGDIYHSFDGGTTWDAFHTELEYTWIYDLDFPTAEVGYGCGGTYFGLYKDVIIKTTDAGATWDTLTTNSFGVYTFNNLEFLNADTGFVASGNLLLRTTDGGESFTSHDIVAEGVSQITDLCLSPDGLLFSANKQLITENTHRISIYRSADLGETWTEVYTDTMQNTDNFNNRFIGEIHFPTADIGYAVGGNGLFLTTTDDGLTWSQNFISPFSNLGAVNFISAEVGFVNNAGGIYKTTNGGITWEAQNMNVPAIVQDI